MLLQQILKSLILKERKGKQMNYSRGSYRTTSLMELQVGPVSVSMYCSVLGNTACRIRVGSGSPGKCWNFTVAFSGTAKSWRMIHGPVKSWKSVEIN